MRQLYHYNTFSLPHFGTIEDQPFQLAVSRIADTYQWQPQNYPTYHNGYNCHFQDYSTLHNINPMFLDVSDKHLIICSKDTITIFQQQLLQGNNIYERIGLTEINNLSLDDLPTSMRLYNDTLFIGFKSGKIFCYNINRKKIQGESDQFKMPVLQIEAINEEKCMAIDSLGNLGLIEFSYKSIGSRITKAFVNNKYIVEAAHLKKREKMRQMVRGILPSEDKQQPQEPLKTQEFSSCYARFCYLPRSIQKQHYRLESIPLAIYSKQKLQILTLDSNYGIRDRTTLLQGVKNVGMLQFGVGGFQKSNNTFILLVASIECKLHYFRAVQVQQGYTWINLPETTIESKILQGYFISNNLLVLLTQKGLQLCNVNEQSIIMHSIDYSQFDYIDHKNYQRQIIYHSILNCRYNSHAFYCIEGKKLIIGEIYSWKQYLTLAVDQGNWTQAMRNSLLIYFRKLKKLAEIHENINVRNQQMKQFFEKICLTYLSYSLKRQDFDGQGTLRNIIDFMIRTQSCSYLFTTLLQAIKSYNLNQEFMQALDQFISQGRLPFMSECIFQEVTESYLRRGDTNKLENMIMSFNLQQMDASLLLSVCLKYELYQSLIHICVQQMDYITPVVKLCGIYFGKEKQGNDNNCQRIEQVVYWYLQKCLSGGFTSQGQESVYIEMLTQVISFLFIPNTLTMLLQLSSHRLMQVVNYFFQSRILQYLLENEGQFTVKSINQPKPIFEDKIMQEFRIYQKMLSNLLWVTEQHAQPSQHKEFNRFMAYIVLKDQFPFRMEYKLQAIDHILSNPYLFHIQGKPKDDYQEQVNGYIMRILDSIGLQATENTQQFNQILVQLEEKISISNHKEFFMETRCYIYHELGRFAEAIDAYLSMHNKLIRAKIFMFLRHNMAFYPKLKQKMLKNIASLISINIQEALNLLIDLSSSNNSKHYQLIVEALRNHPDLQLDYLEAVMDYSDPNYSNLMIQHMQLVFKHKPEKIEDYLYKMDYPLQQAFKLCEESNNRVGMSHVLIKGGRHLEGVSILTEIFLESCDQAFNILAKKLPLPQQKALFLNKQLGKLLQTCEKEFRDNNQNGEHIWQKVAERIFKHLRIQNVESKSIPQSIKNILDNIVNNILTRMFAQVSTEFFIEKFSGGYKSFPWKVFMLSYNVVRQRMDFKQRLQYFVSEEMGRRDFSYLRSLYSCTKKANINSEICSSCQQTLQNGMNIYSYGCGHQYHRQCLDPDDLYVCLACRDPISNFILGKGIKLVFVGRKDQDTIASIRKDKFREYDKEQDIETDTLMQEIPLSAVISSKFN